MIRPSIFLIFFISNFIYSQNIIGIYFPIETKCKLNLTIDKDNSFTFSIGKISKSKGTVKISQDDKVTYLDFSDGISAMFSNDTISLQNSGNSMNPYVHFKECNNMYIHLVKKKKMDTAGNKVLDNKKYLTRCSQQNLK